MVTYKGQGKFTTLGPNRANLEQENAIYSQLFNGKTTLNSTATPR